MHRLPNVDQLIRGIQHCAEEDLLVKEASISTSEFTVPLAAQLSKLAFLIHKTAAQSVTFEDVQEFISRYGVASQ
jgi:hypothetical protein